METNLFERCGMRGIRILFVVILSASSLVPSVAQEIQATAVTRDPQGVSVLTQSLSVTNATGKAQSIQDFTASGTITYFSAEFGGGKELTGSVTLKGRGTDQFKLEAQLPEGNRSFVVSHGEGKFRETTGRVTAIPDYNAIKAGLPMMPGAILASAIANVDTKIAYEETQLNGRPVHMIEIQPKLGISKNGLCLTCRSDLLKKRIFVDQETHQVVRITDTVHSMYDPSRDFPREFTLENYERMGGVVVPTLIRQTIASARIWEIHITSISVNNSLSDADFSVRF